MEPMDWWMLELNTVLGIYGGLCCTMSPSAYLFSLFMKIPSRLFFCCGRGLRRITYPAIATTLEVDHESGPCSAKEPPGQSPPAWQLKILFSSTKGKLTQPRPNHQVEVQKTKLVFPIF